MEIKRLPHWHQCTGNSTPAIPMREGGPLITKRLPQQGTGNSTEAIYTRICAFLREQHHFSEDTPDRVLLRELSLHPVAIEAVRRSNEPYHYPDNGGIDMDLMNLPYEVDVYDSKQLIADVLYSIVRDLPGGKNMHLDTVYNTVTFLRAAILTPLFSNPTFGLVSGYLLWFSRPESVVFAVKNGMAGEKRGKNIDFWRAVTF